MGEDGMAWPGLAWHGMAWHGMAMLMPMPMPQWPMHMLMFTFKLMIMFTIMLRSDAMKPANCHHGAAEVYTQRCRLHLQPSVDVWRLEKQHMNINMEIHKLNNGTKCLVPRSKPGCFDVCCSAQRGT